MSEPQPFTLLTPVSEMSLKVGPTSSLPFHDHVRFFQTWYLKKYENDEILKMRDNDTWGSESAQAREPFAMLGNDLFALRKRFEQLQDYEVETLNDLRDRNVSIPDLIDYIRAEPGFNPEGKPVRTDVASALRRKEFLAKSSRLESLGRSATIAAGSVALLGVGAALAASGLVPTLKACRRHFPLPPFKIWRQTNSASAWSRFCATH